ncbi:MAG: hypothetical protein MJZ75_01835 [Paludibacteraceae bacterium]|nr:hypothetical protein [Paludibacteraceae bacterium]
MKKVFLSVVLCAVCYALMAQEQVRTSTTTQTLPNGDSRTYITNYHTSYSTPVTTVTDTVMDPPRKLGFQVNLEMGCQFRNAEVNLPGCESHSFMPCGFDGSVGLGLRATRWVFVGMGIGAFSEYALKEIVTDAYTDETLPYKTFRWVMPIYLDARIYIPTPKDMDPFVEGSVGGYFCLDKYAELAGNELPMDVNKGIFAQAGVGVDFRKFVVSAGYRYYNHAEGGSHNYCYVKIGFRCGKPVNRDK